jgi:hypothetical protein
MKNMLKIAWSGSNITAALLKINGLHLLLPQGEIRTLESATDVDATATALHSAGWITYAQKRWPVYCLSDELALLAVVPSERRACAMLATGAGYIGILCDDMIVLKDFSAQRYELPVAMKLPDTPILHLVAYEQGMACVSNANQLTSYIEQLVMNTCP